MDALEIVISIVVMVIATVLTAAVLFQSGKDKRSGAVMGSVDTFLGNDRVGKNDKLLSRVTTVLSVVFVVVVVAMYIIVS